MTEQTNVSRLVDYVREIGLEPKEAERKWSHIGGLIVDASLQPRTKYVSVVLPRVRRVVAEWPDAKELDGFKSRLASTDLAGFLVWKKTSRKLGVVRDLTAAFDSLEIQTVEDLAARYDGADTERDTRRALRKVKYVGPKTLDYLAILTGSTSHVAVDMHIAGFVREAGIKLSDYDSVGSLVREAASSLGCSAGALDAAIWNYRSNKGKVADGTAT